MNKKTVIVASLSEIANELDNSGLFQQANTVTDIMVKLSQQTGYSTMETREQMAQIPTWLARASDITRTQASQFNDQGTGKTDENPGWDYIRGLEKKGLYPEVYKELEKQWAQVAQDSWANRKNPKKRTITTPGVHNVDQDKVKNEAWKLVHEALKDKSGDAWTNFKDKLHSNPIFNGNPNGQEFAKRLFYYQLESKGKNPSLKPIQDQSIGK